MAEELFASSPSSSNFVCPAVPSRAENSINGENEEVLCESQDVYCLEDNAVNLIYSAPFMIAGIWSAAHIAINEGLDVIGLKYHIPTGPIKYILNKYVFRGRSFLDAAMENEMLVADSFSGGVEKIVRDYKDIKGLNEAQTLDVAFKWLFRARLRHNGRIPVSAFIKTSDIVTLIKKHGFTPSQIFLVAANAHETDGSQRDPVIFIEINDALMAAAKETGWLREEAKPSPASPAIIDTQKMVRRQVDSMERAEWDVVRRVFGEILRQLDETGMPPSKDVRVAIGPYTIEIKKEKLPVVSTMNVIISKIETGSALSENEMNFIEEFKTSNPVIRKFIDAAVIPIERAILGRKLARELFRMSQLDDPTAKGIAKVFEVLASSGENTTAGLIIDRMQRREVVWGVAGIGKGEQVSVNMELPYYVGPYSFHRGLVFIIGESRFTTDHSAVMAVDRHGSRLYITQMDMAHFKRLAGLFLEDEYLADHEVSRSFLEFFDSLQAVNLMLNKEYKLTEGSHKNRVKKYLEIFERQNWAISMLQEVEWTLAEFGDLPRKMSELESDPKEGVREFLLKSLSAQLERIGKKYASEFGGKGEKFRRTIHKLRDSLSEGNIMKADEHVSEIKRLAIEHLGVKSPYGIGADYSPLPSLDLGSLARSWRDVTVADVEGYVSKRRFSPAMKNAMSVKGASRKVVPSIARARELARDKSPRAFDEYEAILVDPYISTQERMTALAEMAELAIERHQLFRARVALEELENLVLEGRELPLNVHKVVIKILGRESPAFPLTLPFGLRQKVAPNLPAVQAEERQAEWENVHDRFYDLEPGVQEALNGIIREAAKGVLYGYNEEFLRTVAMCNGKEARRLLEDAYPDDVLTSSERLEEFQKRIEPFIAAVQEKLAAFAEPSENVRRLERLMREAGDGNPAAIEEARRRAEELGIDRREFLTGLARRDGAIREKLEKLGVRVPTGVFERLEGVSREYLGERNLRDKPHEFLRLK